jgi:hypothetical protein
MSRVEVTMYVEQSDSVAVHHHPRRHADRVGDVPEAVWVTFGERVGVWGPPEVVAAALDTALMGVQSIIRAHAGAEEKSA